MTTEIRRSKGNTSRFGPKSVRLNISDEHYRYRQTCLSLIHQAKTQLLRAYINENPKSIARAKLTLARWLLKIADDDTYGPPKPFYWGHRLETLITLNIDPGLSSEDFYTTNWQALARKLQTQAMETLDAT